MRFREFKKRLPVGINLEDITLEPETFATPFAVGEPIKVVPGKVYILACAAEYDGVDDGTGQAPYIAVHFDGVEVASGGYGEPDPAKFNYLAGGQNAPDQRVVGDDRIFIVSGDEVQLSLSIEDSTGAQSDNALTIDRFTLLLVG